MGEMERQEEARRKASEELAELLHAPQGLRLFRLVQQVLLHGRSEESEASEEGVAEGRGEDSTGREAGPGTESGTGTGEGTGEDETEELVPIGIWEPRRDQGDTVFVRSSAGGAQADFWAPYDTLVPKKGLLPLRVCLIGESTAAGMFYRPHLTPAKVLEARLRDVAGPGLFEVLDLTKLSIGFDELLALAEAAIQLRPDVLVFFVGNNWAGRVMPSGPLRSMQAGAAVLATEGVPGLARGTREALGEQVRVALDALAAIAEGREIPVVVVVPEVNLADWERRRPPPWLPGDATGQWHAACARAIAALAAGDEARAAAAGARMLELDGGLCSTTHRVLARIHQLAGRWDDAAAACRVEVDAAEWDGFFVTIPQIGSVVREGLCGAGARRGLACVNLAAVFAAHLGSPLVGRRLFLDYCHLTPEGMQVAMAAVAAEVLRAADARRWNDLTWRRLVGDLSDVKVPPAIEGMARLMAALHTAHAAAPLGDRSSVVEHWCASAVEAWPGIQDVMEDILMARCAPCPAVLTGAQRRLQASPHPLDPHVWAWPNLDPEVLETVGTVLERSGRSRDRLISRLLEAHRGGNGKRAIELTRWYHHERPVEEFSDADGRLLRAEGIYRAAWPATTFCFLADAEGALGLDATLRLPIVEAERSGRVDLTLNGTPLDSMEVSGRWARKRVMVGRGALRRGLNRVTLHWPSLPPEGDAALRRARGRLTDGIRADLFPVFGEIFSLVLRPGS